MAKILACLAAFSLCLVAGFFVWLYPYLYPGPGYWAFDKQVSQRGKLRIEVTAYPEEKSFVPGAYYYFEAVDESNDRREIMNFRYDDPRPINKDGIVFVSDDIAYVFMGWRYAITTDAGKTWQVWYGANELPCCDYGQIQDVRISLDGTGTMKLDPNPVFNQRGEAAELVTKDFGRHWTAP